MLAQRVQMDSEAISQSSDSGPEGLDLSQVSRKPKQRKNQCKTWNFQYTLHTDLLSEIRVTTHEKTNLLTQHLQARLGHKKPQTVHSVTVYCVFKSVLLPSTDVSPMIPLRLAVYIRDAGQAAEQSNHQCLWEILFHTIQKKKREQHRQKARIHIQIRRMDLNFM